MDGIERELGDTVRVLRLSVTDSVGRDLAARYGVRGVPYLILLDGDGNAVLAQTGSPQREEILEAVDQLG